MTTSGAYVTCCASVLVPIVGGAWALGGASLAAATSLAGLAVLANVALAERAVVRVVRAAAGQGPDVGVAALVTRQLLVVPAAFVVVAALGAEPVALALGSVLLGALVHALVHALRATDARRVGLALET